MKTTHRLNTQLITNLSRVLFISTTRLLELIGIANSTWYKIMQHPAGITIQQLLAVANGLHIPVHHFFSSSRADFIGIREDYVTEPYTECYYNDTALQEMVTARTVTTWQEAADVMGMSRSRLRDSLLAVTRTPVERFLDVCGAFGIDPFSILIDPNPSKPFDVKTNNDPDSEIKVLKQQVAELNEGIKSLTAKYEALLKAHNVLAGQVRELLNNEGPLGMAAEEVL